MKNFLVIAWLLASIIMLFGANSITSALIAVVSLGASFIVARRNNVLKD